MRGEHEIYALLTPAQRAEIASRRERSKAHGAMHDGMSSHGPDAPPAGE